jgi:O-antigen/teichoic acid export membrane protein
MLGRKAVLIMSLKMVSSALGLISLFFITRYLGAGPYGTITWTFALLIVINSLSDLGFSAAHVKKISEGADIDQCLSTYAAIKIALMAIVAAVTIGGLLVWTVLLDQPMLDTSITIVLIFLGYFILYDLANIITTTFDARMETAKSQIIVLTDVVIRTAIIAFVAIQRMDLTAFAMAYLFGAFGVFFVSLIFLRKSGLKFSKTRLTRSYIAFAIPLALSSFLIVFNGYLAQILIGYFGTNTEVGLYSGILALSALVMVIGSSVSVIIFPTFSKMHQDGNVDSIREHTRTGERYISMVATPIISVIIIFPTAAVTVLLGPDFKSVDPFSLQILMISTLISLLNITYSSQIVAMNRPDLIFKLNLLFFGLYFPLLLLFVPSSLFGIQTFGWSYQGAAIAVLIGTIVNFVLVRRIVKSLSNTRSNWRLLLHFISMAITLLALLLISKVWTVSHWYDLLGVGICAIAVFISILAATGEFKKKDLSYVLDVLNLRQMIKYIKNELSGKGQ